MIRSSMPSALTSPAPLTACPVQSIYRFRTSRSLRCHRRRGLATGSTARAAPVATSLQPRGWPCSPGLYRPARGCFRHAGPARARRVLPASAAKADAPVLTTGSCATCSASLGGCSYRARAGTIATQASVVRSHRAAYLKGQCARSRDPIRRYISANSRGTDAEGFGSLEAIAARPTVLRRRGRSRSRVCVRSVKKPRGPTATFRRAHVFL